MAAPTSDTPHAAAGLPRRELKGNLKDLALANILQTIQERRLTGELLFSRDTDRIEVHLNGGEILFAHSNNPATRLGEWLLMRGKISVEQYHESVRLLAGTGLRQGTILLQMGVIPPLELERSVRQQVCDIVYGLFNWTSGDYRFTPLDLPSEMITLDLSITELIIKGIGQLQNWPLIEKNLNPFSDIYVINRNFDLGEAKRVRLSQEEDSLLHLVDGKSTVEDAVRRSPFPAYITLRALYAFKAARVITRVRPASG